LLESGHICGSHCGAYDGNVIIYNSFTLNGENIISRDRSSGEYSDGLSVVEYYLNRKKYNLLSKKNEDFSVSLDKVKKAFDKRYWSLPHHVNRKTLPLLSDYIKYMADPYPLVTL